MDEIQWSDANGNGILIAICESEKQMTDFLIIGASAAPSISYTVPPVYHRHVWRVYVRSESWFGFADTTPDEIDDDVYAKCDDCPAEMTKDQIEAALNGWRVLTDE